MQEAPIGLTTRVTLTPKAGFVVKSTLKSKDAPVKVFINICWDSNVPPPPEADEEAIRTAMVGQDDETEQQVYFIPVIVSDPRNDVDKAGRPSLVFDCVVNTSVKSRTIRDPEFKAFIIELCLQRVEDRASVELSRPWAMPNIHSKGVLKERTALIPLALFPEPHPLRKQHSHATANSVAESISLTGRDGSMKMRPSKKPLIEEIDQTNSNPQASPIIHSATDQPTPPPPSGSLSKILPSVKWEWLKTDQSIYIEFHVPNLVRLLAGFLRSLTNLFHSTRDLVERSTLDLEPRRIILDVPSVMVYDLDLDTSDFQLQALFEDEEQAQQALLLKRSREFDVDHAIAEWRVAEEKLIIVA